LSGLADRKAVVNLPVYKAERPRVIKDNERVISKDNRHGRVTGFTSNKAVFSFSVRVHDANVVKLGEDSEEVGAPRNFMLVGLDGEWRRDGWRTIEFHPTAKENAFLTENKLWTGNKVVFQNFVHPNRWISMYGRPYFVTKALIQRLVEERAFLQLELKKAPATSEGGRREDTETYHDEGESRMVTAFEAEVLNPFEAHGSFKALDPKNAEAVLAMRERSHQIQYEILPELRFAVRATELAFLNAHKATPGMLPGWMPKGSVWRELLVKRTTWQAMEMPHIKKNALVQWRQWQKKEEVAVS
jgi:hypothetical protein